MTINSFANKFCRIFLFIRFFRKNKCSEEFNLSYFGIIFWFRRWIFIIIELQKVVTAIKSRFIDGFFGCDSSAGSYARRCEPFTKKPAPFDGSCCARFPNFRRMVDSSDGKGSASTLPTVGVFRKRCPVRTPESRLFLR